MHLVQVARKIKPIHLKNENKTHSHGTKTKRCANTRLFSVAASAFFWWCKHATEQLSKTSFSFCLLLWLYFQRHVCDRVKNGAYFRQIRNSCEGQFTVVGLFALNPTLSIRYFIFTKTPNQYWYQSLFVICIKTCETLKREAYKDSAPQR